MATIGLDNLVYCPMTEDDSYGAVKEIPGIFEADINPDVFVKDFIASDGAYVKTIRMFRKATVTLKVEDLKKDVLVDLLGCEVDDKGVLLYKTKGAPKKVAIGFRSLKSDQENYRYVWLYKGAFQLPQESHKTIDSENVENQSPTIVGTFFVNSRKEWKATIDSDDTGANVAKVIEDWFKAPYGEAIQ